MLLLLACTPAEPNESPAPAETEAPVETSPPVDSSPPVDTSTGEDFCTHLPASSGYEATVERWVEQDELDPLDDEGWVVFTGSSSIRRWERVQQDFAAWGVIQRGFGGARLDEVALFSEDLITRHAPSAVVVFAGTNDVAAGESADTVVQDFRCLVQRAPEVPVVFIGITPTPARWGTWDIAEEVNQRVSAFAQVHPRVHYADVAEAFLQTGQPPDASLFVEDQLHLSPAGYALWTAVIKPALTQALEPAREAPKQPLASGRVLVDLGPSNPEDGGPTGTVDGRTWSNWHPLEGGAAVLAGEHVRLNTVDGSDAGLRLTISGQFANNGLQNGGLKEPSEAALGELAVATATQDYFFTQGSDAPGALVISGFPTDATVSLRLFASRNWASERRVTRYVVTGADRQEAALVVAGPDIGSDGYDGNTSEVAEFTVKPDPYGQIVVDVQIEEGTYGYLALMDIAW